MTLHRRHHVTEGEPHNPVRLSLRDQLDLQQIVLWGRVLPDFYKDDWSYSSGAAKAVSILQRHGVAVSLDPHSGSVTFNPEVTDA